MKKSGEVDASAFVAFLAECSPQAQLAVGFELALVGVGCRFNKYLAVYDYAVCVRVLMERGLSLQEASEYMEFNVVGAWVGEWTPIFLHRNLDDMSIGDLAVD